MNVPHFITLPVKAKRWGVFPYYRRQAFYFCMGAWMDFYDEYGWDMEAIPKLSPGELTAKMVYHAARHGNFRRGLPFDMNFAELAVQVAGMRREDGEKLDAVFRDSASAVIEKMQKVGGGSKKK